MTDLHHGDMNVKLQGTEAAAIIAMSEDVETIKNKDNTVKIDQTMANANEVVVKGKTTDAIFQVFRIDAATHAIEVIDYEHHEVHSGSHFYIEGFLTMADAEALYIKLVTPNTTKWAHFTWDISSSGILTTTFLEDASGGMADGTAVTIFNSNRNRLDVVSALVITKGVTVPTTGLVISSASWGAKNAAGGAVAREDEIILKQNTIYCRTFLSGSAANKVMFRASWYEHTDK